MRGLQCVLLIVLTEAKKVKEPRKPLSDAVSAVLSKKVDEFSKQSKMYVPFGHIGIEGFGDNDGSPIDFAELMTRYPKSLAEERKLLRETNPEQIHFLKPNPSYLSPREKFMDEQGIKDVPVNETQFRWYDLAQLQASRLNVKPIPEPSVDFRKTVDLPPPPSYIENPLEASDKLLKEAVHNFTTCDEFGGGSFYPKDIVKLDWIPFYVWSPEKYHYMPIHKFHYATKKLVNKYRSFFWKRYKDIDWNNPKVLMRGITEILLIAINRKGLFHGLALPDPEPDVPDDNIPLQYYKLRFKIQEPYLAYMYCNQLLATIMAVHGNEPTTDEEKITEASILGYRGRGQPVSIKLSEHPIKVNSERIGPKDVKRRKLTTFEEPILGE